MGLFDISTGAAAKDGANVQIAALRAGYITTPGRTVRCQPRALLKFQQKNAVISTTEGPRASAGCPAVIRSRDREARDLMRAFLEQYFRAFRARTMLPPQETSDLARSVLDELESHRDDDSPGSQ
jgi:hypothetical protein